MVDFVDLKREYHMLQEELDAAIAGVVESGNFILGQEVEAFEKEFAEYCGADYAVGLASGTDAIEMCVQYAVPKGAEILVPANTFHATVSAVIRAGCKPVLVDVQEVSYGMDPECVRKAITKETRAIIPVHMFGHPVNASAALVSDKLFVLEDACQAHGAKYHDAKVGTLGHASAFSFYPTKNLGAYGDGGMVVTNNDLMYAWLKLVRNYGQTAKNKHTLMGWNSRLDTIQAAILRVKLKYLDSLNQMRTYAADYYTAHLRDVPGIVLPGVFAGYRHVWHLYVIRVTGVDRDRFRKILSQHTVQTGVHYPVPIHMQPAFSKLGYSEGDFPVAEQFARTMVSLPMHPYITTVEMDQVIDAIRYAVRKA